MIMCEICCYFTEQREIALWHRVQSGCCSYRWTEMNSSLFILFSNLLPRYWQEANDSWAMWYKELMRVIQHSKRPACHWRQPVLSRADVFNTPHVAPLKLRWLTFWPLGGEEASHMKLKLRSKHLPVNTPTRHGTTFALIWINSREIELLVTKWMRGHCSLSF